MTWIPPALVATSTTAIIVAAVYLYLFFQDREKYLLVWGIGWASYSVRFIIHLLMILKYLPGWMVMGQQMVSLISGFFFIRGIYLFIGRPFPLVWTIAFVLNMLWVIPGTLYDFSFISFHLPASFFLGTVYGFSGWIFLKYPSEKGIGHKLTGWSLILWGIHKADYPFLRTVLWFAPWGYLLASFLFLSSAIGLLLVYFERIRSELRQRIQERLEVEESLRESEKRFRAIADYTCDLETWVNPDGRLLWINSAVTRMTGYTIAECMAASDIFSEIIHEDDRKRFQDMFADAVCNRKTGENLEFRICSREGAVLWICASWQPIYGADGEYMGIRAGFRDITDRKEAEAALTRSEELYSLAQRTARIGSWDWNIRTGQLLWSREIEPMFGFKSGEFGGTYKAFMACVHPDDREYVADSVRLALDEKVPYEIEHRIVQPDGNVKWVLETGDVFRDEKGQPVRMVGIVADISLRKKAEEESVQLREQLQQAQKMEAIGTLAGGIAHDFNNILAAMIGYTEMARDENPPGSPVYSCLEQVLRAGIRARELVKQILAFSRQTSRDATPIQAGLVVREALRLLRASIPATIEIHEDIDGKCGMVLADPTRIHQIVMNLCTNARHAMMERGGVLGIRLGCVRISPEDISKKIDLAPGEYVRLEVSDTGHGMTRAVSERIFEPYFTTKPQGEGTGMGLAVVHGIVKTCGGHISVCSEPGQGSMFHVYLPRIQEDEVRPEPEADAPVSRGHEHILFVDDEEMIVHLMQGILGKLGYRVTALGSSPEALDVFRKNPGAYHAVITDMTMPGMTGAELARELIAVRPDIPVILSTGFSENIDAEKAREMGIRGYIMKPVVRKELAETLRKILDHAGV